MKWTSIRVDVRVRRRLDEYRRNLEMHRLRNQSPDDAERLVGRLSLGDAITQLLDSVDSRRERRRKHKRQRPLTEGQ